MVFLSEAAFESALLEQLRAFGYSIEREEYIGPGGHRPEREGHDEVVLHKRFKDAVDSLNPRVLPEPRQDANRMVTQSGLPALLEMRHPHSLVSSDLRIADVSLKERGL